MEMTKGINITPEETGLSQKICRRLKKERIYKLKQLEEYSELDLLYDLNFTHYEIDKIREACLNNGIELDGIRQRKERAKHEQAEAIKRTHIFGNAEFILKTAETLKNEMYMTDGYKLTLSDTLEIIKTAYMKNIADALIMINMNLSD